MSPNKAETAVHGQSVGWFSSVSLAFVVHMQTYSKITIYYILHIIRTMELGNIENKLALPKHRTDFMEQWAHLWNSVPSNVRAIRSFINFKNSEINRLMFSYYSYTAMLWSPDLPCLKKVNICIVVCSMCNYLNQDPDGVEGGAMGVQVGSRRGLVQSLNSPFFPPPIGAEPGRAKGKSRITCMRMLRTPPFFPPNRGKNHIWNYFPDSA